MSEEVPNLPSRSSENNPGSLHFLEFHLYV